MTRQMIESIEAALKPFWDQRSHARVLMQMERAVKTAINAEVVITMEYPGALVRVWQGDDIHRLVVPAPVPELLTSREL